MNYLDQEWRRRKAEKKSFTEQEQPYDRNFLRSLPLQNLPRQTNDFIGREKELKQLLEYMDLSYRASYINVGGIGGVGKTALVCERSYS